MKKILATILCIIILVSCSTPIVVEEKAYFREPNAIAQRVLNDTGLVAEYLFNNNTLDTSGNNNHGILYGAIAVPDRFGTPNSAYYFDGIDDYITIKDSQSLDSITTGYTLSLFINTPRYNHPDASWQALIAKGDSPRPFSFYTHHQKKLHISSTDENRDIPQMTNAHNSTETFTLNTWTHVAISMEIIDNQAYVQYYIAGKTNGKHLYADLSIIQNDDKNLLIGKTYENVREFKGYLDDIRIYNRALNSEEIFALSRM